MPNLYEIFDLLKSTQPEYQVVADAVARLREAIQAHQADMPPNTSLRDYEAAGNKLEATYTVRLWAEFEAALRSYRRFVTANPHDQIRARDLIDWAQGVEAGRRVDNRMRDLIHEVRVYRNSLVHEREEIVPAVGIGEARHRLSTYLAKLPERW